MNIYIYNIRIITLANGGSFNIGTTLNMVQNRERLIGKKKPLSLQPPLYIPPEVDLPDVHPSHPVEVHPPHSVEVREKK